MDKIIIESNGIMPIESFSLMGVSTKRGEDDTIGQFGTGLKYGIAGLLRDNIEFQIMTGGTGYEFKTKHIKVKEMPFNQIQYREVSEKGNKRWKDIGYSSEMGLNWDLESCLRELVSNAIDEGGFNHRCVPDGKRVYCDDKTYFIITSTTQIRDYFRNLDKYFLINKTPLWISDCGCYARYGKQGTTGTRIYKKGVLVYTDERDSLWDYDLKHVPVEETRKASESDCVRYLTSLYSKLPDPNKEILLKSISDNPGLFEGDVNFYMTVYGWGEIISKNTVLVSLSEAHLIEKAKFNIEHIVLTHSWVKLLTTSGFGLGISAVLERYQEKDYKPYYLTEYDSMLFNSAIDFIKKAGYSLEGIQFKFFINEDKNICGEAEDNNIYIFETAFRRGKKDMVDTILHEYYHIESGELDQSLEFEHYIIGEIVKLLEIKTGDIL